VIGIKLPGKYLVWNWSFCPSKRG